MTKKEKLLEKVEVLRQTSSEAFDFMEMMDAESLKEDWKVHCEAYDELIRTVNEELE